MAHGEPVDVPIAIDENKQPKSAGASCSIEDKNQIMMELAKFYFYE